MVKSVETTASSVYLQAAMTTVITWYQGQALRLSFKRQHSRQFT